MKIRDCLGGTGLFAVLAASGGIAGCGSVAEPSFEGGPGPAEDVAQVSSALTKGCRTDPKGYLTSCVFQCSWSAYSTTTNSATCSVPSGYVLTGGGAEIEGEKDPGALLTGSTFSQSPNLKTWLASSSAPLGTSIKHRIRAYAIGLKIKNVTESTLRNSMQLIWTVGGAAVHKPSVYLWNDGYGMTVGGGTIQYNWVQILDCVRPPRVAAEVWHRGFALAWAERRA